MLRIEPLKDDQAPSAILELVDGPKDTRFAMTALTLGRIQQNKEKINEATQRNIDKVTQFREGGQQALQSMVKQIRTFARTHKKKDSDGDVERESKK